MEYKENKRETGTRKEELAADFLTRRGVKILERNFRCRQGEIDLIGMDGQYLVFVEVKYRKTARNGMPAEAGGRPYQAAADTLYGAVLSVQPTLPRGHAVPF